jgi:predicted RNA-binding protein with PUA-like domain
MSRHWLFKTEPGQYSYSDLEEEKKAVWDGVSNSLALKHLREIRMGDEILIYHSGDEKAIVGLALAVSDPYPDPSENDEKLVVINVKPRKRLARPLSLAELKGIEELKDFDLVRLPRLSVMPVPENYWHKLRDLMSF